MEKRGRFSVPAVGGSSLMVIFAVLCLTVFALLSLSTVQAEKRLGDASVATVSAYYEADRQAEEIFARLRSGEHLPEVEHTEEIYSYECPISDGQVLSVELRCNGGAWTVLRWQAVSTVVMDAAGTLAVWDGE